MEINLSIDTSSVEKILVEFIQNEITRAGFSRAVINLSGGLDSSVSCALTARALGAANVLALRLPYSTSSRESLDHAQQMIDQLGIQSLTYPITTMVDSLIALDPKMNNIRRGNIMARVRMIVAYDQSAAFNGLVVGTGNKTEILLGYTTLYGDSACAFNPLGDLYKTQVRQLAHSLGVPEEIIAKPPSADLWSGQTDEGELGFRYTDVDRLLYLLADQRFRPEQCIPEGFSEPFVHAVIDRIRRTQFKRNLPPIAKLSDRTGDFDLLFL